MVWACPRNLNNREGLKSCFVAIDLSPRVCRGKGHRSFAIVREGEEVKLSWNGIVWDPVKQRETGSCWGGGGTGSINNRWPRRLNGQLRLRMFLLQSKKMQERVSNRQQGGSQSTLRGKWGTTFLNYRAHKDNTTHLERLVLSLFLLSLRHQDSAQE